MKWLFVMLTLSILLVASPSGTIIQIAYKVPMSNERSETRDFFVDLGSRHGVSIGDTLEISRQFSVLHSLSGQPWHFIRLVVGEATVIANSDFVSLARATKLVDPSRLPATNYHQFMLGDLVSNLRAQN